MDSSVVKPKIKISNGDSIHLLDPDSILFFRTEGQGCTALYQSGREIALNLKLDVLEKKVSSFFRINADCLVNLFYLSDVSLADKACVVVGNQYSFPIDPDKKQVLLEALSDFSD